MYVTAFHTGMSGVDARAPNNASSVSQTILGRNTKDVTVGRRRRRQRDVIHGEMRRKLNPTDITLQAIIHNNGPVSPTNNLYFTSSAANEET